jgi:thiol-disulfide isomerase/thioredoxin
MTRLLPVVLLFGSCCLGQPLKELESEEKHLSNVLAEAGSSPVDFIRAIEEHLARFPESKRKPELERALVKAAMESKDDKRIILYGERVLARENDDAQVLERVARALLSSDAKDTAERALKYARRYQEVVAGMRPQKPPGRMSQGQWQEEIDRGLARALVLQARATGNLGRMDDAIQLARKSYDAFPTAEAAREIGRWLAKTGKEEEAVIQMADAFTITDPRNTDTDRARDRQRMGELYRKVKGSEKGLGDLVLQAYDRTTLLMDARKRQLRETDPNAEASNILDFTLTEVNGDKLNLASLRGKAVVFDFWATWCGPCRAQHPLYEEVKSRFKDNPDVVFLAVNTDENREVVEPFLRAHKWDNKIYFEDGLAKVLQINSIPTTVIVGRRGEVVSRMNGFLPDRFVDMLSDRIRDALKN